MVILNLSKYLHIPQINTDNHFCTVSELDTFLEADHYLTHIQQGCNLAVNQRTLNAGKSQQTFPNLAGT